ncbi:Ig-like domain-containing protein [Arenivirga flava]|uniref:Fibronectin type III n=1 Tax=Arenivirga flava TaxID=1930060 RepID=A0AA37UMW8_9MICO|nr:Ig-like domain-containing protein [Arenivirga flava]GMA27816.1 fibronectin type III [Arenivirga flava]
MGARDWWRLRRKAIASTAALAVTVSGLVGVAALHDGFPVTEVDLNARDVWVTNQSELVSGRLNRQIEELNGAVFASSAVFDVVQQGEDVFLYGEDTGAIEQVDPATTTLAGRAELPIGSEVSYGNDVLSVVDPESGSLWVVPAGENLDFDPATTEPHAELGRGGVAVTAQDGTVFAVNPSEGELLTITDPASEPEVERIDELGSVQLTTVGDTPVILDEDDNRVLVRDRVIELPETALRLQQVGGPNGDVVLATATGLLLAPLSGGEVRVVDAELDAPANDERDVTQPVWLNGCAHGAWAAAQQYLAVCTDEAPATQRIPEPTAGAELVFRVNRDVIALNNVTSGDVWLVDANMRLVDNWDEVTPPEVEQEEEGDEKTTTESFEDTLADRTEENRPPVARDDVFGARPGRTTILPVLQNDTDPDGDVLVVTEAPISEASGVLDFIDGGRTLQFTPAPGLTGQVRFTYTVEDGRGGVATANVTVNIRGSEENSAPESLRNSQIQVEQGQSVTYNVLTDWLDPDGDEIYLVSATPTSGDAVQSSSDGDVTFQHLSGEIGVKEVQYVVSDGRLEATGTLAIEVVQAGTLNPIGTPDFAETYVGQSVRIEPLLNDISPSGAPLQLLGTDQVDEGLEVTVNTDRSQIVAEAARAGTYYLIYSVGAGAMSSVGIVRVDVKPDPDNELPPIAVKDIAYLRAEEPVTIPVLANDISPSGRVLAVQSVQSEAALGKVAVETLELSQVRLTSTAQLTEPIELLYTISDGLNTASATISVVPIPALVRHQPPVAVDDIVNVRAGDIVTVDVLDNDYHPDGVPIELEPELVDISAAGDGEAFITDGEVRYQAPLQAGVFSVSYRVTDQFGETAMARVEYRVSPADESTNRAPLPLPLTSRTFAGNTVRIDVPLDGIDPDGDSVVLLGETSAPSLGRITERDSTGFVYEAFANSIGTDTFRYRVQDTLGLTGIGEISIGVVPRPETVANPIARDDNVEVAPGRTASVPVLANDSDPNGYQLRLQDPLLEVDEALVTEFDGPRVVIEAPETPGFYSLRYEVTNGKGGVADAYVQVNVTPDARALYPTALDKVIEPEDVVGADTVEIDLLDGAQNPGGRVRDLVASLSGPYADQASILDDGRTVRVTPGDRRVAITYTLTNEVDELSASAFIIVPPASASADTFPPPFYSGGEQRVEMNGELRLELEDILTVPSGQKAIVINAGEARALNSDGTNPIVDEDTLIFRPGTDYRGSASIAFEVTDGEDVNDATGRTAFITVPILVGDPDFRDTPPTFSDQRLEIEAGEAPRVFDLRDASGHENPDVLQNELRYTNLRGAGGAIDVGLSGNELTMSASRDTRKGTSTTVSFDVVFEDFTVPGSVEVVVVASQRPLTRTVDDRIDTIERGSSETIDVLANDVSGFPADEPLRVTDARLNNGADVDVQVVGDRQVRVSAAAGINAQSAEIVYTVEDPTGDPDRNVNGRLLVDVRDAPDQPTQPQVDGGGLRTATVSWRAPSSNNSPITGYTIQYSSDGGHRGSWGPGQLDSPTSTIQTVTGLRASDTYRFTIIAHNAIGNSQASTPSNPVVPYEEPGTPTGTQISASNDGQGTITMRWAAPGYNGGRDLRAFEWRVNGGAASGTVNSGSTTTASWKGQIGTAYSFEVRAQNTADQWSAWSETSGQATATPSQANGLNVAETGSAGEARYRIAWNEVPASSGGADDYRYRINGGPWSGWSAARQFDQTGSRGEQISFQVQTRKNGTPSQEAFVSTSNQITLRDWPAPGRVDGASVITSGTAGNYGYSGSWSSVSGASGYQWELGGNGGSGNGTSTPGFAGGPNQDLTLRVRAYIDYPGGERRFSDVWSTATGRTPGAPAPTTWQVSVHQDTCPEQGAADNWGNFNVPNRTCRDGFIPRGTTLTVACITNRTTAQYPVWYRIVSGAPRGATTTAAGMSRAAR